MKLNITSRSKVDPEVERWYREIARQVNGLSEGSIFALYQATTSAPTTGTWARGDFVTNSAPAQLGTAPNRYVIRGWSCVAEGTPGTWVENRIPTETWASGSGSGITRTIASIAIATTAAAASAVDYVYFVTGTTTLTLPTVAGNTSLYTVKSVSGVTTVACNGAETIDGTATIGIAVEDSVDLLSNGTEWKVV